jgi:hypothetical protein
VYLGVHSTPKLVYTANGGDFERAAEELDMEAQGSTITLA